jgi:hypothetical protein
MMADKKLAFLPMAMSLPPIMIWLAASIFVYASIAHHPDLRCATTTSGPATAITAWWAP